MSIGAALARGRRAAEALMTDTCTIRRDTGDTAQDPDPDTGTIEPVYSDLFSSSCKVQARSLVALDAEVGGRTATTVRLELHLPVASAAVQTGDIAEITAVGASSDSTLVGRKFTISAPVAKSFATARRYEVEEIVS